MDQCTLLLSPQQAITVPYNGHALQLTAIFHDPCKFYGPQKSPLVSICEGIMSCQVVIHEHHSMVSVHMYYISWQVQSALVCSIINRTLVFHGSEGSVLQLCLQQQKVFRRNCPCAW